MAFQKTPGQISRNYKGSDVKIYCEDQVFDCHKFVLSNQSEVFRMMLTSNDTIEATSGEIKIKDISVTTLNNLLVFLYRGVRILEIVH